MHRVPFFVVETTLNTTSITVPRCIARIFKFQFVRYVIKLFCMNTAISRPIVPSLLISIGIVNHGNVRKSIRTNAQCHLANNAKPFQWIVRNVEERSAYDIGFRMITSVKDWRACRTRLRRQQRRNQLWNRRRIEFCSIRIFQCWLRFSERKKKMITNWRKRCKKANERKRKEIATT